MTGSSPAGFPHSGTTGSMPACGSPVLFAAYRALPRLSVPRHPPCALLRLTGICLKAFPQHRPLSLQVLYLFRTFPPDPDCQITTCGYGCAPLKTPRLRSFDKNPRERSALRALSGPGPRSKPPATPSPTRISRKEVIQPQVPLRLPCYDFAPVIELAFGRWPPCGLPHGLRALPTSMA